MGIPEIIVTVVTPALEDEISDLHKFNDREQVGPSELDDHFQQNKH